MAYTHAALPYSVDYQLSTQEHRRLLASEAQNGIADQLSSLAAQEYQGDILNCMQESEVRSFNSVKMDC